MATHSFSLDWRPASRIRRNVLVVIVAILTLGLSAAAFGPQAATNAPIKNATLDIVNVGSDTPSGRLTGFGPPEPLTHPGVWGGAAPGSEFYRVLWFQGDEPFGIVELRIPPHSVAQKLEIDYLNGLSGCFAGSPEGDSFNVYAANSLNAAWSLVGTVVWDSSACTVGDQERAVAFYLPSNVADLGLGGGSKGKDLFVMLVSTAGAANEPWPGFVPFGQVAIHTVKLTGKMTHAGQ
jgi:hypothetical protein